MTPAADAPVVAALSSSEAALRVARAAAREAAGHGRALVLLHALNWSAVLRSPSVLGPRDEAENILERAAAVAAEVEPELPVSGEIVEGPPLAALVRRAESAFLVAVGDGGMSHCEGCVPTDAPAVQLAAQAGCPVLVVRHEPAPQGPVLVGVDGSSSSWTALEFAFDCAERRSARLLVLRVTEPPRDGPPGGAGAAGETGAGGEAGPAGETSAGGPAGGAGAGDDAHAALAEAVARCGRRHPSVSAECHVVVGDPGTVLVDQSRSAQLAVVAARGDEPLRGMLGAVSQSLLYHSPAPVVVVRGLTVSAPVGA
ncbi:universal stress protein [Micromonospora okii]|uniref:universal stress protein n=1 Tax=Micromonospora okii TaxID=1182970 RepID=UPI001E4F62A6|nr:universal stress protein [Micromonospora okii]